MAPERSSSVKSVPFGAENMKQLFDAARQNLPHHRFLLLMGVNMSQMILAFVTVSCLLSDFISLKDSLRSTPDDRRPS